MEMFPRFLHSAFIPRYYFRLGDEDDGDEGIELDHDAAACEAARDFFGHTIKDGEVKSGASLVVSDETGRRVVRLSFSEEP